MIEKLDAAVVDDGACVEVGGDVEAPYVGMVVFAQ